MAANLQNPNLTSTDSGLDSLAHQAEAAAVPPLGEGSTDLDVAASAGQGPAPAISNAEMIKGALVAGRDMFCLFTKLDSPRATMDEASLQGVADLWGKVCDKRQINLAGYLGDYAAEIAAAIATISLAASVRAGVMAELAERRANEPKAEGADAPADAAPLETPTSGG